MKRYSLLVNIIYCNKDPILQDISKKGETVEMRHVMDT